MDMSVPKKLCHCFASGAVCRNKPGRSFKAQEGILSIDPTAQKNSSPASRTVQHRLTPFCRLMSRLISQASAPTLPKRKCGLWQRETKRLANVSSIGGKLPCYILNANRTSGTPAPAGSSGWYAAPFFPLKGNLVSVCVRRSPIQKSELRTWGPLGPFRRSPIEAIREPETSHESRFTTPSAAL